MPLIASGSVATAHPIAPTYDRATQGWILPRAVPPRSPISIDLAPGSEAAGSACEWTFATNVRAHPDQAAQHLWPDIALGPGGLVAVAWMDDHAAGGYHIFYSTSIDGGITWTSPEKIDNRAAGSYSKFVDLEFTPSGVPVAVWEDDRLGGINAYFSKRDPAAGGTPWTPSLKLNTVGGAPTGTDFMNLSIAILDDQRYYVAWTDWREGALHQVYARGTTNGGTTWGTETRVSDEIGFQPVAGDPCLIVDQTSGNPPGSEVLHCVTNDWRGNVPGGRYPNVYAYRSTNGGATWSIGVRVNDIEPLYQQTSSHALVQLADGTLCAGWLNSVTGPSQFRTSVSTDQGQTWSASVQADPGIGGGTGTYSSIIATGSWAFAGFDIYEGNWNAYLRISSDGGRTWVADACRMDDDVTGSPTSNLVLAARSPVEVFGAWSDGRPGGAWKIYTTHGTRPAAEIPLPPESTAAGLRCQPNPSTAGTPVAITWDATGDSHELVIYDAQGRGIRTLPIGAGAAMATWDGRNGVGRLTPAGLYWVRVAAGDGRPAAVTRVVRVR
jgi:hypothetical protein